MGKDSNNTPRWNVDWGKVLGGTFSRYQISASVYADRLASLMKEDPRKGVQSIFEIYNRMLDDAHTNEEGVNTRADLVLAGGPHEMFPRVVCNAVGAVYPYLPRELQDLALKEILEILDNERFTVVNGAEGPGYTTGVREPLLLTDITIARSFYWPGLDEGRALLKNIRKTFLKCKKEL